jgi:hypothetical protein
MTGAPEDNSHPEFNLRTSLTKKKKEEEGPESSSG